MVAFEELFVKLTVKPFSAAPIPDVGRPPLSVRVSVLLAVPQRFELVRVTV